MSVLNRPYFYDEAAAFDHVEAIMWPQGPVCHHCSSMAKHYKLAGVRTKPTKKNPNGVERHGLYKCKDCRKQFTVRMGTIFEESHLPLHKWLQAIHLMCSSKKGISAHQLHRVLECTYKTAWFLAHRIREAMRSDDFTPMSGTVESDETYIGRLAGTDGKGMGKKNVVLTLVERGGKARSFHVASTTMKAILPIVNANITKEAHLFTDEGMHYRNIGKKFEGHRTVNHGSHEYGRYDTDHRGERVNVHTNTVEGYYSIFKRGMKGVYQHCAEHHLHRYLAEFDFRYNHRIALGIDDAVRSLLALKGFKGRRLTYRGPYTSQA